MEQQYTPEQIQQALARVARMREVERAKYLRNREHRLAYSKAYHAEHKEEIAEKHRIAYRLKHPKKTKADAAAAAADVPITDLL